MIDMIVPYQQHLVDLLLTEKALIACRQRCHHLPILTLNDRQLSDVECLLTGAFSPLRGFMTRLDYDRVVADCALDDNVMWPIPIVLDVRRGFVDQLKDHSEIALCDQEGMLVALLTIEKSWQPDKQREAKQVYGSIDLRHPGVFYLLHKTGNIYLGGRLQGLRLPAHYDFSHLRQTPQALRQFFTTKGWDKIVALQTRNPLHKAHHALAVQIAKQLEAYLLLHPVASGQIQVGDIDYYTRVRCYEAVMRYFPTERCALRLLPLAMRMAGLREACLHAVIRQNYGCSHFIVGRDHAGPQYQGQAFYSPFAAQAFVAAQQKYLQIKIIKAQTVRYDTKRKQYVFSEGAKSSTNTVAIAGKTLRKKLRLGEPIPEWFSYPEVIAELTRAYPPQAQRGLTIFITGLPAAGKSSLAHALYARLRECDNRVVSVLDGDIIRHQLAYELGFSKADRDCHVKRVGYLAAEITKHRGIAICAMIAPFYQARQVVRQTVSDYGGFVEVYVATSLPVCERRDQKNHYAKARKGLIKDFTGVSASYEVPAHPDVVVDMGVLSVTQAADVVITALKNFRFV